MRKNLKTIKNKKKIETSKGITLIALVITIIVLLILAGVSIAMLTGQNGILTQANKAKEETEKAQQKEEEDLDNLNKLIENTVNGGGSGGTSEGVKPGEKVDNTEKDNYTDTNGDKATIPGGFTLSGIESEQKVSEGLVIYDIPDGVTPNWTEDTNSDGVPDIQTKYNQFVWIPVKDASAYQRDFSYPSYYDENLETTPEGSTFTDTGYLPEGIQPETDDATNNENAERASVLKYNGFYVGRYEAGKETSTLVSKQNATVWTDITQTDSKTTAKTMYNNNVVKSALCSGIQWDMVMHFVDKKNDAIGKVFDVRVYDGTRHTGSKAESGKNNNDKVQNIYDLEGNCWKWVAEKNNTSSPFVSRGGDYHKNIYDRVSKRSSSNDRTYSSQSFRPTLYIM